MKNFPDSSPLDELEKRLQNYTEEPDDLVWKNINATLRPQRETSLLPWFDYGTLMISLVLFVAVFSGAPSIEIARDKLLVSDDETLSRNFNSKEESFKTENRDTANESKSQMQSKPIDREVTTGLNNFETNKRIDKTEVEVKTIRHAGDTWNQFMPEQGSQEAGSHRKDIADTVIASSLMMIPDSVIVVEPTVASSKRRMRRVTFYVNATPMLTFLRVTPESKDGMVVTGFNNPSILSAERFGIGLNAGIQGYFSRRFEYYGGLSFYQQNQTLQYMYQSGRGINLDSDGDKVYTVTPQSSVGILHYNMVNVGVHAGVLYHLYGKKLAHKIGGGLQYQQGLTNRNSEVYKNSASSYLAYQLFYRNEMSLNARLRFFIQPVFAHTIHLRETLDAPFKLKPYSAGIGIGLLYNLR